MPHTHPRHLTWPNCRNLRDPRGLHTRHHHALIRTDNLDQLTTAMLAALTDRYGTVDDYLLAHGMTHRQRHALRTRLTTP